MGDSMADWLAYGLELAFSESPEIGIVRKHRTNSSLIFNQGRHDIRTRNVDWANYAKDVLTKEPANFVVFMIGLSDRESMRDRPAAKPAVGAPAPKPEQDGEAANKPAADAAPAARPDEPPAQDQANIAAEERGSAVAEFKSDRWLELYSKRVDEIIATLKAKGVPVIWVGLPPVRGARSMAEISYLNDIYRARAEKAGITYVDVWDGFVDDGGRFAQQGPDLDGQFRRLRTSDGTHFTQFGARKLAHYVEKEIRRALTHNGLVAVPLPVDSEQPQPAALTTGPGSGPATANPSTPRPLAGPVVPLNALNDNTSESDELAGGAASSVRQGVTDAVAARVLIRGEPMPAPAGRADDFAWPRRGIAPVGADPVSAVATLPMTPMVAERPAPPKTPPAATARAQNQPRTAQAAPRPAAPRQQEYRRYQQQSPFFFFFGGR